MSKLVAHPHPIRRSGLFMDRGEAKEMFRGAGYYVHKAARVNSTLECEESEELLKLLGEPIFRLGDDGTLSIHGTKKSPQTTLWFEVDTPEEAIEIFESKRA